jgi:hypothetical protein
MADKLTPLMLDALGRAVAQPAGLPLHGGKGAAGLFPLSTLARQAAQRCKDEGLLHLVRTETKGKTAQEICALTEKGLAYLLSQVNPKQVLEDLVRALEARQGQVGELVATAQKTQESIEALRGIVARVLDQLQHSAGRAVPLPCDKATTTLNGSDTWVVSLLAHLRSHCSGGALEDCPLPELFRVARQTAPTLTIGHFHDALRRLHEQHQIYLHPWTGPLYEMPEPPLALLIGHEIAYYASPR